MYNEYDYLYHHGIKGQKWGVRRYQNEDGSLTSAGRVRYGYGDEKKRYESDKRHNEKIKQKALSKDYSSGHRKKLVDKYKSQGMNDEEAKIETYKRIKTERVLAIAAGVGVAALTTYVVKNQIDKHVDKIIPSNTLLQNISTNSEKGVKDAFYASFNRMDKIKYKGMYGNQLNSESLLFGLNNDGVFETRIGIKDGGLKLASENNAMKVLNDLVIGKENEKGGKYEGRYIRSLRRYLSDVDSVLSPLGSQKEVFTKAINDLKDSKITSSVYEAFNISLADHSVEGGDRLHKDFYDALKSKGYDAILDVNDKKYSGYHTSKPIIVFNGDAKTFVDSRIKLGEEEVLKNGKIALMDLAARAITPTVATTAGSAAASMYLTKQVDKSKRNKIVSQYKKEHPNTNLSYNEILDNYYNQ